MKRITDAQRAVARRREEEHWIADHTTVYQHVDEPCPPIEWGALEARVGFLWTEAGWKVNGRRHHV
jgi:hypothetical protein